MSTNFDKAPAQVKNGVISLQESLNDYPKVSLTEYVEPGISRPIGEILEYAGMSFILDSISIEKCPIEIYTGKDKATYSYVHVSSKIMESPLLAREFAARFSPSKKENDTYFYPIGSLVSYAKSLGRLGNTSPPGFLFPLSKSPGPEETITLKDIIDERLELLELVYDFKGDTLLYVPLASKGLTSAQIVKNYTVGYGNPSAYKDSPLSWNKNNNNSAETVSAKRYKKLKDSSFMLYEGDYNPHLPPPETADSSKFPRDLSIMFDNSGVTKTCKITKYKWNKPEVEVEATFGYAHAAIELVADPNKPNVQSDRVVALMSEEVIESGNAYQEVLSSIKSGKFGYPDDANFSRGVVWRLISVKEKEYIYQPVAASINPRYKKEDGSYERVTILGDYSNAGGSAEVLIREVTQGWEIRRFAQEDAQNWTSGSIQSWINLEALIALKSTLEGSSVLAKQQYYWMLYYSKINLEKYLYRKIPLWEQVDYGIEPYSSYYRDAEKIDWQVQWIPKNQLAEYKDSGDVTEIPIVFPDPNWEPQLMLLAQSRLKMSIGLSGNPDYDPYKRNYYGTNPISVTTGSEEYELTIHNVLPSKNTKTGYNPNYVNIPSVIASMQSQAQMPGTVYSDKPRVSVPDYGLRDYPIPVVQPTKVLAGQIGSLDSNDDQYSSITSLRTAQDHSYKNHLTTTSFVLAEGRPPQATTRKPVYEEVKDDTQANPYTGTQTFITSSNYTPFAKLIAGVSVGAADNIHQAIRAASFKLTMEALNSSSSSVTLHYPSGNAIPILNTVINLPITNASWCIKGSTQVVQFSEGIGFPQPIEVDCGILMYPDISSYTIQLKDDNNNGKDSLEVEVTANLPRRYGTPIEDIPAHFGRWLDTN